MIIAAALLCAGCAVSGESTADSSTADTSTPDSSTADSSTANEAERFDPLEVAVSHRVTEAPTAAPTEAPSIDDLAMVKYHKILSGKLGSDYAQLDHVEAMNQMYGMQAACEALALTAAINHFGYDLDSDDIVDDYLEYSDNFVTGYCGNPRYFYDGAGIYPPGLVTTTWNFIEENDAKLYPFDTTGVSMSDLYKFVDAGCPVLIWTTYDRGSPYIEQSYEYDGVYYPWYDTEHCVCLFGYHLGDNEVKIADSWNGGVEKWEDADRFEDIYDEVGQFSMILMDTSDLR